MTLKQNYMPWSINIGKGFSTEPLACGLYLNTVFGDQFWVNESDRYPKRVLWIFEQSTYSYLYGTTTDL